MEVYPFILIFPLTILVQPYRKLIILQILFNLQKKLEIEVFLILIIKYGSAVVHHSRLHVVH